MFRDRSDAGRSLARKLEKFANRPDVLVLALPRGGVPVGAEVARSLGLSLDVFLVRKLGVPGREELAMGAIASGGVRILNDDVVRQLNIPPRWIELATQEETAELRRREKEYRDDRPQPDVRDRIVILVDDGLATGASMKAAVAALRRLGPARIVVAVPVGARETCAELDELADEVVCAYQPAQFLAVGNWYERFDQTSDNEVRTLLATP